MSTPKLLGFIAIENVNTTTGGIYRHLYCQHQNWWDLPPLILSTPKQVLFTAIDNVNTKACGIYGHW